jgi:hypothetical protein
VLKDAGEVMTDAGPIRLDANSQLLMQRTDAELLIRQGVLEQL